MINVGNKPDALRTASASARLLAPAAVLQKVREGSVHKGDPLAVARIAGIQAAKRTDDLIPLCHPLPIHACELHFELEKEQILIRSEVGVIGSTGVEMEALAAVSAAALTIYDMLKMYCGIDEMRIEGIALERKTGGKQQFRTSLRAPKTATVLVLSDTVAAGRKPDTAGQSVAQSLRDSGFEVDYAVLADEAQPLLAAVEAAIAADKDFVATVGGTGIGPRDITVDTLAPLIRTALPGIMEAARSYGQRRTPYALMSRGIAGLCGPKGRTLLMTFPGSRRGAEETLAAVHAGLIHLFDCRDAFDHAGGYQ